MEAKDYLSSFYEQYDEDGRLVSRHGSVEYLTTMRYVHKHLKPGMRILEIGAATGRYSHALAREGYSVDAIELLEHNIEIFKQNTLPDERVTISQGNAVDAMDERTFEIYLKYHFAVCERQDLLGYSQHTLDIFKKN